MATTHWPVYSDLAKEHYGKGQVETQRLDVLTIVEERGLMLTEAQRERIADSTDLVQLKKWFKAAITAKTADDLFS